MRIAYCIINHNKREGTSKAIAEVAERLAQSHEVHIFARSAEGVDLRQMTWHRIPGPAFPHLAEFLGYVWPCSWMVRSGAFNIIHAAGSLFRRADVYTIQNIQPAKRRVLESFAHEERVSVARRLSRAAYLHVTSRWERKCYERTGRPLPFFLPVSGGVERELRASYDIRDSPVRMVPNAADTLRFGPVAADTKAEIRASFGLTTQDFVCVFAGGEWRRKGLDLAIAALSRVRERAVKLLVLGRDDSAQSFLELSREHGVADRVVFAGFQPDVERGLACADVFLFPSRYEAFSLAVLEAAACGLPVIATKISGTEEFIEPGLNGEFVALEAPGIASAIERLCAASPAARDAMGKAARRKVERDYTWDRVAAFTEEVYRTIHHERI